MQMICSQSQRESEAYLGPETGVFLRDTRSELNKSLPASSVGGRQRGGSAPSSAPATQKIILKIWGGWGGEMASFFSIYSMYTMCQGLLRLSSLVRLCP